MPTANHTILPSSVLIIFTCFIIGTLTFLYGFFPLTHNSDERAGFNDIPDRLEGMVLNSTRYRTRLSHTILMIIDAFRYDFVSSENMEYTFNQINKSDACIYKIKVDSPTVTMPRIKSLTTGSISNFVDVVLNFGSPEMVSDSIIHQMYDRGDKIVFYGDNTWTKLFPGMFYRKQENLDSFFVNDFYEGDKNITKRLAAELKYPDWNFLILHYLGLDHIGHVESSFSPRIPNKLREMDRVAQQIYISMNMLKRNAKLPPLFILTGDHGMRNSGGHGGSSEQEIFIPFVTFGIPCKIQRISHYNQIDIAPTLAVLLGFPIPATNIGKIITEAISFLKYEDQLYILFYNTQHLMAKIIGKFGMDIVKDKNYFLQYKRAMHTHKLYLKSIQSVGNGDKSYFKQAKNDYEFSSKAVSELLAATFIHFDMFTIALGLLLTTFATIAILISICSGSSYNILRNISIRNVASAVIVGAVAAVFICNCSATESDICNLRWYNCSYFAIISIFCYIIWEIIRRVRFQFLIEFEDIPYFLIFGIIYHAFSLISSSFIEEEHQTWYYFSCSCFILILCSEIREVKFDPINLEKIKSLSIKKILFFDAENIQSHDNFSINARSNKSNSRNSQINNSLEKIQLLIHFVQAWSKIFIIHLFVRRLNQTGDKWLSIPDIGDWFVTEDNRLWLSCFLFAGLLFLVYTIKDYNGLITNVLSFTAILLIYYYRTISGSVLLFDIKESRSKTSLIIFWLNIIEILAINYIPILYRMIFLGECALSSIKHCLGTNITLLTLILALLRKPHNVILLPVCIITLRRIFYSCNKLYKGTVNIIYKVILSYWIGKMFFFYDGNSNNLASIDLNAGYIGLDSYNPVTVPIMVAINTYSGPILCFAILLYNCIDPDHSQQTKAHLILMMTLTCAIVILPLSIYFFVMTFSRTHIFVWTVFSPKILYECFNTCLYYVMIIVIYCVFKLMNVL